MSDVENQNDLLDLLATHRRTVSHYLRQQAALGIHAPPEVTHGLHAARESIARIKAALIAGGLGVADLPGDAPEAAEPVAAAPGRGPSPAADATPPRASRILRVFLCHASGDKAAVRALYQRLRAEGFKPWLDEEDLLPGQDWQQEIPIQVRAADAVIVCLSRHSVTKVGYVQKEIKYALDAAEEQPEDAIFIIPLRLDDCDVPARLRRWQWVNYYEEQGYDRLMRALRARAAAVGAAIQERMEPRLEGVRILLVEDDSRFAASIVRLLQIYGGSIVEHVPDVATAQRRLSAAPAPELVLTNYDLHGAATGEELALWMQSQPQLRRSLRVLFSAEAPAIFQSLPTGLFDASVIKYIPIADLAAYLAELLDRRAAPTD
jgi:CheY-like chemotaxis protein